MSTFIMIKCILFHNSLENTRNEFKFNFIIINTDCFLMFQFFLDLGIYNNNLNININFL